MGGSGETPEPAGGTPTLPGRGRSVFLPAQLFDFIEQIKTSSSKWIKELETRYCGFFWQRGYGAFSVSPSQLDAVLQYVDNQEEHHRNRTFQKEYRELLRKHGIEFDERYLWIERGAVFESRFQRSFAISSRPWGFAPVCV